MYTFLSCTKHPFVGHKIFCHKTVWQQYSQRNELKVFVSPGGQRWKIDWHTLQIAKAYFKYLQGVYFFIVVHPSTKSLVPQGIVYKKLCTRFYNFFSPGLIVFIDINMYLLTESRNFKTFLKENYVIAWDSCYLFTKI